MHPYALISELAMCENTKQLAIGDLSGNLSLVDLTTFQCTFDSKVAHRCLSVSNNLTSPCTFLYTIIIRFVFVISMILHGLTCTTFCTVCLSIVTIVDVRNLCLDATSGGRFAVFDPRASKGNELSEGFLADSKIQTSTHYADNYVLLGCESGKISAIDLRNTTTAMYTVYDPFVQAVSHIAFNDDNSSFIVSGLTEYVKKTTRIECNIDQMLFWSVYPE